MAKNFIKKIRFYPMLKFFSHERTRKYFEGEQIFPINIEFSISGVCQANCRKCFYKINNKILGGHDSQFFDFERMKDLLSEFKECDVKSISWTGGGEPTLHPDFTEIVELTHSVGIQQGLFTNALRAPEFDSSLFEWIRVTKTNHEFPKENIKKLLNCKTVGLCINFAEGDFGIIFDAIQFVEELNVKKINPEHDVYLQIRPEMNILGEFHECSLPKIDHPLVDITEKIAISKEGRGYSKCTAFHFVPFIWQNGDVDVCAYQKGKKQFNLGNLHKKSFKDIMVSAPEFVKVSADCMACCKLHEMNRIVEERKNLQDINFI